MGFLLFLSALHARAENCQVLAPWLQARQQLENIGPLPNDRARAAHAEEAARESVSRSLFALYMNRTRVATLLRACTARLPDRGNLYFELNRIFYQESLLRLRASRSSAIRTMLRLLDERHGPNGIPVLQMSASSLANGIEDQTGLGAGFHRGSGSVYLDIDHISPDDWLVKFVHEMIHVLESELENNMQVYNNSNVPAQVAALTDNAVLTPPLAQAFDQWLRAGLSRGLWMEYRIWVASFHVYEQGKAEGLWRPISWMEDFLRARPANVSLEQQIYRYLDSRSADPTEGFFSRPRVQRALQDLRARMRTSGELPALGRVSAIR